MATKDKDKDYGPLPPLIAKGLNDKLYEKRKTAALELERTIKELNALGDWKQVDNIAFILNQEFIQIPNANSKKGGLIGLAATAIALGIEAGKFIERLIPPVLSCFHDQDSRVRYYACEALYNVAKVSRRAILPYFTRIFDDISKLAADPDFNVKNGAELLDRLIKDIVTESPTFDVDAFIHLLRDRIYSNNQHVRQFIVQWITLLDAVPQIDLLKYLPEFLDGMFLILSDPSKEIRRMCQVRLGEFVKEIRECPNTVNYTAMANILVVHCQSQDRLTQHTALQWVNGFITLAGRRMLPLCSGFLTAILPCVAYHDRQDVRDVAIAANQALMKLITSEDDHMDLNYLKRYDPVFRRVMNRVSSTSSDNDCEPLVGVSPPATGGVEDSPPGSSTSAAGSSHATGFQLQPVIEVLTLQLLNKSVETRLAVLRWMLNLHDRLPKKMFLLAEQLFPVLLSSLSDASDEVVLLDLEVIGEISSSSAEGVIKAFRASALKQPSPGQSPPDTPGSRRKKKSKNGSNRSPTTGNSRTDGLEVAPLKAAEKNNLTIYFTKFMTSLVSLFSTDRQLLEDRGSFIIRQLCLLLDGKDIYCAFAEILLQEDDLKFASTMVRNLNMILLTSVELFTLRSDLRDLKSKDSVDLFSSLYHSWSHSPVATVSLCLLTQTYKHACSLICKFGDINVNAAMLSEIDKMVQLIESPVFVYLRLQMLEPDRYHYLIKALNGLLMLLPQTSAFTMLRNRLSCVPTTKQASFESRVTKVSSERDRLLSTLDFDNLLRHFETVQAKHSEEAKQTLLQGKTSLERL